MAFRSSAGIALISFRPKCFAGFFPSVRPSVVSLDRNEKEELDVRLQGTAASRILSFRRGKEILSFFLAQTLQKFFTTGLDDCTARQLALIAFGFKSRPPVFAKLMISRPLAV